MKNKIVLAYSGGLDTSAIIPWLKEVHQAEVIAYCCDLGNQPNEALLQQRALDLGASDFIFEDLKSLFASDFVFPMQRAGATYQEDYLLGTAIARPIIAYRIAKHAKKIGAYGIAHGATGKGNDHIRFEKTWASLSPETKLIAPWKEWCFKGRRDLLSYLSGKGYEFDSDINPQFSVDSNLFHCSTEGGILEHLEQDYNHDDILKFTSPNKTNDVSELHLEFENGYPTKINGTSLKPVQVLKLLNEVAGKHGIGVVDIVEERSNGIKSRGIYETPGGTLIAFATKQLKQICWDRKLSQLGSYLAKEYGQLIYDGDWYTPARFSLESFFQRAAKKLDGQIALRLKGPSIQVINRSSPFNLYRKEHVSFEEDELGFYQASLGYSKFITYPNLMAGKVGEVER